MATRASSGLSRREVLELGAITAALASTGCAGDTTDAAAPDATADATPDASEPDAGSVVSDAGADAQDVETADAPLSDASPTPQDTMPASPTALLTFVHINDLHGHYNPSTRLGSPLSRAVGFLKRVREENPTALFIDGGDDYEKGSVAEVMSDGWATLDIIHGAKFDVRVLGNHDFAWSVEQVRAFTQDPHADVLCANVTDDAGTAAGWAAKPWVVREVDGVRVGFFGLVSSPWNERNENIIDRYFPELSARFDYEALAAELVAELRERADVIVFVSHLGLGTDRRVCEAVPGIDLVIGAHSHDVIAQVERVGDARIVQTGSAGQFVGRVDLEFDRERRTIVDTRYTLELLAAPTMEVDADTEAMINEVFERRAPGALDRIARTSRGLSTDAVAALIADVAVGEADVDAALCDTRILWAGLPSGSVTRQDFLDACKVERQPAGTSSWTALHAVTVSGATLARARAMQPGWAYAGPEAVADDDRIRLVVPKYAAYHPEEYLGGAADDEATWSEVWALLTRYAMARTAAGLHLDADLPLEG